jgi:hypothetical protein
MSILKKIPIETILIIGFLLSISSTQILYDKASQAFSLESFKFKVANKHIVTPPAIEHLSFGFTSFLADYYWISAVQDLTGWNHQDTYYLDYFNNISTLDPHFTYPYLFSIFTAPSTKIPHSIDTVATYADRGIVNNPSSWDIPFYMATKYKTFAKDNKKTEHYLSIAARIPAAPPVVGIFYSAFTSNTLLGRSANIAMLQIVRDTTDSDTIKKISSRGLNSETIRSMFEQGVVAYKATFGRYPKNLQDLTKNHFVTLPPELEKIIILQVNPSNGTIKIIQQSAE